MFSAKTDGFARTESPHDRTPSPVQEQALEIWYPVCLAFELGLLPLQVLIYEQAIVLFRDREGLPAALEDRCPHRDVPLSMGRCEQGSVVCSFHGWRFNSKGDLVGASGGLWGGASSARCEAFTAREQQGIIWVWACPESTAQGDPPRFGSIAWRDMAPSRRALSGTKDNTRLLSDSEAFQAWETSLLSTLEHPEAQSREDLQLQKRLLSELLQGLSQSALSTPE